MPGRAKAALAAWITGVWTITVLYGMVTGDLLAAQIVSPPFLITAGYYFGSEFIDRISSRRRSE